MKGQFACFWALMKMDFAAFGQLFKDRLLNFLVWSVTMTMIAGYVFPIFGMDPGYGRFFFAGILASVGMFEAYARVVELVNEMSDDRPILYYITLPLSSNLLVLRMMLSNAIRFIVLSICIFPVGWLVLGSMFSVQDVRWGTLLLVCMVANAFYGACSVWLACRVPSMSQISNVWTRLVFPIWFLGGLQFSQAALAQAVPWLAVINRANPVMYITESFRGAVLGGNGFTDVRVCMLMLLLFTGLIVWRGMASFRRRLDLVG